jgi:hypothetical protein
MTSHSARQHSSCPGIAHYLIVAHMNSQHRVNSRTCLPLAITILSLLAAPAFAQSGIGGPTKPINHVGGATTTPNPVVPPSKGVTANAAPSSPTPTKTPAPTPTSTSMKKK